MKLLLVTFAFISTMCSGQTIPDTCFTEQQIFDISRTLDSLWETDSLNNVLIDKQSQLIKKQTEIIRLDSMQQSYYKQQVDLLQKNIDLYVEREKRIQPKWYDSKALWFSGGILSTILTAKLIVDVVK